MIKNCEFCGIEFTDTTKSHCAKCCCKKHSTALSFNRDRPASLFRLRINNLRIRGVILTEDEVEHAKNQLELGICELCGKETTYRDLVLDHNHSTKKFRGVICMNCNHLLGMVETNLNLLTKCFDYIQL